MLPRRFEILRPLLLGKPRRPTHHVPLGEIIAYLCQASASARGNRYVRALRQEGEWSVAELHGVDRPLYFPKEMPFAALLPVLDESFNPTHWHQYERNGTPVEPDDIVVDCGAAEGLFALRAALRCRKVYALEPLPGFVRAMQKTFAGMDNVTVIPQAVSDKVGETTIQAAEFSSSVGHGGVSVRLTTVDTLFADAGERITYLKADVEGFEEAVLAGAERTIRAYKPKLAITTYHLENDLDAIVRRIRACRPDYQIEMVGLGRNGNPVVIHAH